MKSIEFIEHLVNDRKFDNVLGVHEFETSHLPALVGRRVFQLIHNTPGHRILCEDWGEEILILDNSYMTSFLDNLALVGFAQCMAGGRGFGRLASDLTRALAKKFFAEQLFVLGDSEIARVLFLETIMEYDHNLQQLFKCKNNDPRIKKSSDYFTACAADFLRNHEFGHIVSHDEQYIHYLDLARQEAGKFGEFSEQSINNRERIVQEIASDLFGINIVMGIYASRMSGASLRNYLTFLAIGVVRMHVLYDLAADTHRVNVDENFDVGNIDDRFVEWRIREMVMVSYIDGFVFGPNTVVPLEVDDLIHLDIFESGLVGVTEKDFCEKSDDNFRRLASLIASGFAPDAGFNDVINGTRPVRVLNRID